MDYMVGGAGRRGVVRRAMGLMVAAAVASTVGGSAIGGAAPIRPLTAAGVGRVAGPADAPVAAVVTGAATFGYQLAGVDGAGAAAGGDGNWFASPLSVAMAFGMLRAGAGGTTAAELDRTFGFPSAGLAEAFNTLTSQIGTTQLPPAEQGSTSGQSQRPPVVCLSNGLFPSSRLTVGPAFLRTLAEQYGAGVYPLDYHSASAVAAINRWVADRTAGRITSVFNQLPAATQLVLANTVYLRADWRTGFLPSATAPAAFTRADGRVVQVPTMHAALEAEYAAGDGWQAVQLPYAGDLAMRLVVPTGGSRLTPRDLLAPQVAADLAARLRPTYLAVALPKVRMTHQIDLARALPTLGVRQVFTDGADLSGIAGGLYLSAAVHRATVTIDEQGTEAAAVTGMVALVSAGRATERTMQLDRPFAFTIVHVPTGMPLFAGEVGDPSTVS